jgi:hypothetical protein
VRWGLVVVAALAAAFALPAQARAGQCGLPDVAPLWIDFADGTVPFRSVFSRPGVIVATAGGPIPAQFRTAGAQTIYWEMSLSRLVGTPLAPLPPDGVTTAADNLAAAAALSSGCTTPLIALNELFGTTTPPPWDANTAQYRANALAFLQELALKGARPFLLLPSNPNPAPELADWWRQAAQFADLVREVYFAAPSIESQGPILGSRTLRTRMRAAVQSLTGIGIPPAKVGLMLGFYSSGAAGRAGLQPREAWLDFVKLNVLAARQVATELGLSTVWNWGWGAYSATGQDADKPAAACVALWTRDPTLCDAPTAAGPGFDTSLAAGQIDPAAWCSFGTTRVTPAQLAAAQQLAGDEAAAGTLLLQRAAQSAVPVARARVLAAEQLVVKKSFQGKRSLYTRALARDGLTVGLARGILLDELRGLPAPAAQQAVLATTVCAGDVLPAAGSVRLADRAPYLKLQT